MYIEIFYHVSGALEIVIRSREQITVAHDDVLAGCTDSNS